MNTTNLFTDIDNDDDHDGDDDDDDDDDDKLMMNCSCEMAPDGTDVRDSNYRKSPRHCEQDLDLSRTCFQADMLNEVAQE